MIYKSCDFIESGICFLYYNIPLCCYSISTKGKSIFLVDNYHGEKIDWDKIFEIKQKIKDAHKKGDITAQCQGCAKLVEKDWDEKNTIKNIVIQHWAKCNCNCTYCTARNDSRFYTNFRHYKIMPVLKDMLEKQLLEFNGNVLFGGGEPTRLDELDEVLDLFISNGTDQITINSSGIEYSEAIARALSKDALSLTISPDSGTKRTYKKIKRVDTFEKVWGNVKKYCLAQGNNKCAVKTKYIIIPKTNDNIKEIEEWIQKSIESGVKNIVLDIESSWFSENSDKIPSHIYDLVSHVQKRAKELELELWYYSLADQLVYDVNKNKEI